MTELLKHDFSPAELSQLSEEQARQQIALREAKDGKKTTMAAHTAAIKAIEQELDELANKIRSKSEMRQVEVRFEMNTPKDGIKQVIRVDNDEILFERRMTDEEKQQKLFGDDDGRKRKK